MWGFGAPRCLHPKGQFCLYANKASMMQFKTKPSTPPTTNKTLDLKKLAGVQIQNTSSNRIKKRQHAGVRDGIVTKHIVQTDTGISFSMV